MKPFSAYASLRKVGNKAGLLLFLILLAQVFFLLIGSQRISLPSRFVEIVVNSFLPDDLIIKLEKTEILGFSELELHEVEIWSGGLNLLEIQGLSMSLNPSEAWNHSFLVPNKVKFDGAHVLKKDKDGQGIKIKEFSLNKRTGEDSLFLRGDINMGTVSSSIHIEIRQLDKIGLQFFDSKKKSSSFTESLKNAFKYKTLITSWTKQLPDIYLDTRGLIDGPSGELMISQKIGGNNKTKNFLTLLKWNPSEKSDLTVVSLLAKADEVYFRQHGMGLRFINPILKANSSLNLKTNEIFWSDSFFSYQNLSLDGKMSGNLPKVDIYATREGNFSVFQILSDTNGTKISLHAQKELSKWGLNGSLKINPKNIDLLAHLSQGSLKALDGDKLSLCFWTNPTPLSPNRPVQFIIQADNFSALETPPGKFRLGGEIADNFSIWVNEAYGKLGKSEVFGKYYQKWKPARYRFLVDGTCHPPDISNWLGVWWSPIWKDFTFPRQIPQGSFSISGIWAGPPGNAVTAGWVKTNKLAYKGFEVENSKIEIEVDKMSTRLKAKNISHKHGQANGTLVFPRNLTQDKSWMDFSFDGDYPVNQAKELLGVEIAQVLSELNASVIYTEAKGQIYRDQKQDKEDKNGSWYKLYLSSKHPFSYSGVELDYAQGTVESLGGVTKVNFDKLGVSGGQGTLSISKSSEHTDKVSLDIELKNADRNRLTQNLLKSSQWQDQSFPTNDRIPSISSQSDSKAEGIIDFSLQAEGPLSEYRHFEGSGNFKLYKVEIGTTHILGGIRSKLGAFNLPLPSDALSFNQLNGPFLLDHDRILFDQATLSGPLSTFEAKGEVNWVKAEVDLLADLKLAGNLKIPVLKQLINLADPLSRLSTLKIKGNWENPDWTIHLRTNPLKP